MNLEDKSKRIIEVISDIKKEVGYDKLSDWDKKDGVAHWGGMTNDFFVIYKHEAYGESHERMYSWTLGDFEFKKVSERHTKEFCHKKLSRITVAFEMENFEIADSLHTVFNKHKK
jgi:hypothetical protein